MIDRYNFLTMNTGHACHSNSLESYRNPILYINYSTDTDDFYCSWRKLLKLYMNNEFIFCTQSQTSLWVVRNLEPL